MIRRFLIVSACASAALITCAARAGETITYPFQGVRHIHRTEISPRLLNIHIVEIDLRAPGVGFRLTPPNGDLPGETTSQTTLNYLVEQGAQVAINGDFYAYDPFPYTNLVHLGVSDGVPYSAFNGGEPAINLARNNVATRIHRDTAFPPGYETTPKVPLWNAIGGNEHIVSNGSNVASWNELHPRTALGYTADQKLLMATVDGRQPGHSLGMTTPELANLLISYGVREAINLDGGGSTTMAMNDGSPRLVNVPIGTSGQPGSQRRNGLLGTPIKPGTRIGHWTILLLLPRDDPRRRPGRGRQYLCKCACGRIKLVTAMGFGEGSRHCGCRTARTHGHAVGARPSPTNVAWYNMIARCNGDPARYPAHSGRGIRVCPKWIDSFEAFLRDVGERPGPRYYLDRIDNDGHYEPGNVRWVTPTQSARNKSTNRRITVNGVTRCLAEWAELSGVKPVTISRRLAEGWPAKKAIFAPAGHVRRASRDQTRGGRSCRATVSRITAALAAAARERRTLHAPDDGGGAHADGVTQPEQPLHGRRL